MEMAFVQSPPGTFPMMPYKARTLPPSKFIGSSILCCLPLSSYVLATAFHLP